MSTLLFTWSPATNTVSNHFFHTLVPIFPMHVWFFAERPVLSPCDARRTPNLGKRNHQKHQMRPCSGKRRSIPASNLQRNFARFCAGET